MKPQEFIYGHRVTDFQVCIPVVSEGSFVCQSVGQRIGQNVHFESRTAHYRIHTDLCL